MDRLLTVPEVAELLQVSEWSVKALVRQGRIPVVRIGRSVRFRPADLERWVHERVA